jgi:hypothetical protein
MIGGGVMLSLHTIVTEPNIKEAIAPLNIPAYVWAGLTVLGVVTFCAHGHNGDVE